MAFNVEAAVAASRAGGSTGSGIAPDHASAGLAKILAAQQAARPKKVTDPNGISDLPTLKTALNSGQITHNQFIQRFSQIQKAPIKVTTGQKLKDIAGGLGIGATETGKGIAEGVINPPKYFVKTDILNPASELLAQASGNKAVQKAATQKSVADLGGSTGGAVKRLGAETAGLVTEVPTPISLTKILNGSADAALTRLKALPKIGAYRATIDAGDRAYTEATAAANATAPRALPSGTPEGQKLLTAGPEKPVTNESTRIVLGTASTPSKLPVNDEEYTQRFNALSKSYEAATKAAAKVTSPLKQKILADNVDDEHSAALEQLDYEYEHGKENPNYQPATSGHEKQTGFQIVSPHNNLEIPSKPKAALALRINQIDSIIQTAARTGSRRSATQLRGLLKEKQDAQAILDGKKSETQVYGPTKKATSGNVEPLPFGDEPAPAGSEAPPSPKGIVGNIPAVQAGDTTRQAVADRDFAINKTIDSFHEVEANKAYKDLAPGDIKVLEKLETKEQMTPEAETARAARIIQANAKNPEKLQKLYDIMRPDLNTVLAHRQALTPTTGELSNYFQHFPDRSDAHTNAILIAREEQEARAIKANPSYSKHRSIATYADYDRLGLKRANANVFEDYLQTIHGTAAANGQAALIKGLQEAHGAGSVIRVGTSPSGENLGNIKIHGGNGYSLSNPALAQHYNFRAPVEEKVNPNLGYKAYAAYGRTNKGAKNILFAGGAFHGTQSALTATGQQIVNAVHHPLDLGDNISTIAQTFSSKARDAHIATQKTDGANWKDGFSSEDGQRLAGLTFTSPEVQGDLAGAKTGILNRLPGVKQLHSLVFDRQIPAIKQMVFNQYRKHANLDLRNPADLAKARSRATVINNTFGGINAALDGLPPKWAKIIDNVALARDYQQGRATVVAKALGKWGKNNPDGVFARQAVVGKSIVTALPAMIALVATGKLNPKDPKAVAKAFEEQVLSPQIPTSWKGASTKSAPNGAPISLHLPATYLSDITKIVQPIIDPGSNYDNSRSAGIKDFASARIAALPADAEKVATNRDYYGNHIFTGGPKQTAENIAEQFAPIPVQQGAKLAQGKQNLAESVLNEAGLRASSSTLPSPTLAKERETNDFYNLSDKLNSSKTGSKGARAVALNQRDALLLAGKWNQAARVVSDYNNKLPQYLAPFTNKYKNFSPEQQKKIAKLKISTSPRANAEATKSAKASQSGF